MIRIKIGISILTAIAVVSFIGLSAVMANSFSGKKIEPSYASGRIIVKFKGDVKPFRLVKVSKGQEMKKVREYQVERDVVYAEPDYKVFSLGSNDTAYSDQWALQNTGQTIYSGSSNPDNPVDYGKPIGSGKAGHDTNWEKAWENFSTSPWAPVTIAVVDSGIDNTHPDLSSKIWENQKEIAGNNGIDDDNNGYIDDTWGWDFVDNDNTPKDVYGHGTHVSGIAAAETNNSIGIAGVAFPDSIKIMPVRVLDENGTGYVSNVAKGIYYATDEGAKVINLSLGGSSSNTLKDAVNYAWRKRVLLAAAAGNDGGGRKYYPASYNNVISVAATDYNDKAASFSNFNRQVEIAAPGVDIFSTFPSYPFTIGQKYGRSEYYDLGSGTSMATPHVSGLAALLFAQDSQRTNSDVRSIIDKSADDLGATGRDIHYGYGRINVYNALTYTGAGTSTPECVKNGKYCNCNGKCDKFETTGSCPLDCPAL